LIAFSNQPKITTTSTQNGALRREIKMDLFEAIEKRRSYRKFLQDEIPETVMRKALSAALLAPNSSNLQPWEFYWVRNDEKKNKLVKACFDQNAAKTAKELVVAVSQIDTWKRNRNELMRIMESQGKVPTQVRAYYEKAVPLSYFLDPVGLVGLLKKTILTSVGMFRPVPRRPTSRADLFEVVTKTTALACENFMLAMSSSGFDTCPMEGFDEVHVKKILGLGSGSRVVMVMAAGKGDPAGLFGGRVRLPEHFFLHEV